MFILDMGLFLILILRYPPKSPTHPDKDAALGRQALLKIQVALWR
jgi:hypothetical protein